MVSSVCREESRCIIEPLLLGELVGMRREIGFYELERGDAVSSHEGLFVLRLQANEDAAYDELVRTYHVSMYQVAYRMLGDSAEASDVVQEIFLKVFRNIHGFRGDASLKTWIFRIALSEILNRLRWWKRRHRSSTVSLDESRSNNGNGLHVRDSKPCGRNLDPLLGIDKDIPLLLAGAEVIQKFALKFTVISFAQIAFLDLPIHVIAIRAIFQCFV